jgi:hypothetical protein
MRNASHHPEYPQRRDEEQTGAEIATKVLGRNDKSGQAPFYTGLYSAPRGFDMKLTRYSKVIRLDLVVYSIYALLPGSQYNGTSFSLPKRRLSYPLKIKNTSSTKVSSICPKGRLVMSFYGLTFTMCILLRL